MCIEKEVCMILPWLSKMSVQRLPINQYDCVSFFCADAKHTSGTLRLVSLSDVNAVNLIIVIIYLFTEIGLSSGGSGYFTCIQNMKLVTTKFKSGGLHEKQAVATWNVGNRLSVCL